MSPAFRFRHCSLAAWMLAALTVLCCPALSHGQSRPVHVTAQQAGQAPFRDSGRLFVQQGGQPFTGTATTIRRYTGLTAAHLLYQAFLGFSADVTYEPSLYGTPTAEVNATYLGVLAGYQETVDRAGENTQEAFAQDIGFLIFDRPATGNRWAPWSNDPDVLTLPGTFLALGYAGVTLSPIILAQTVTKQPFTLVVSPNLYENASYLSEGGMSGGPLYAAGSDGVFKVVGVGIARSFVRPQSTSVVRAIVPDDDRWLREAEYLHGAVNGGFIRGPAMVAPGRTAKFKTGVTFLDGTQEGSGWTAPYEEAVLTAAGSRQQGVIIARLKPGKFAVRLAEDLPSGTCVKLVLRRNTTARKEQTPLASTVLTVE